MMATYNNSHPLPAAPMGGAQMQPPPPQQFQQYQQRPQQPQQQQQQPQQLRRDSQLPPQPQGPQRPSISQGGRPKSRTFSFKSDRSQKSSGKDKLDPETHAEKEAKRLHTKADPTLAINEAEPSAVAATVRSSLTPLRNLTHRDSFGNPIAEPDRSNPTRYRWERPLDTIRSFEAAIDGGYSNRKSTYQPNDNESVADNGNSRRSSYFNYNNARYPQNSYYGGRPQSYLPQSHSSYDVRQGMQGRDSYYDQGGYNNNNGGYGGYGPSNRQQRFSRMQSEPQIHGMQNGVGRQSEPNIYPMPNPNNHRSYETVASGSGSGTSAEAPGYQTDPTSSDNSSIERVNSPPKPKQQQQAPQQPTNDYGISFQSPNLGGSNFGTPQTNGYSNGPNKMAPIQLSSSNGQSALPPVPQKNVITRKPTNQQTSAPPVSLAVPTAAADKRKSWFARRFSKQN